MTATPTPTEYRVEWCGNIKVYHPVRPSKTIAGKDTK